MTTDPPLASPEADYEASEARFLGGIRERFDHSEMAPLAVAVRDAARIWNSVVYREYFAAKEVDPNSIAALNLNDLSERTEVLSELWSDITDAYGGGGAVERTPRHSG